MLETGAEVEVEEESAFFFGFEAESLISVKLLFLVTSCVVRFHLRFGHLNVITMGGQQILAKLLENLSQLGQ